MEEYMIPCLFKKLTGFDCLGCGAQRAFVLFFSGDFENAFKLFPAVFTTLLFFIFIGFHFLDAKRNYSKILIVLALINTVIMIISYIYKMQNLF